MAASTPSSVIGLNESAAFMHQKIKAINRILDAEALSPTGSLQLPLFKSLDASKSVGDLARVIAFTQSGYQAMLNWRVCDGHKKRLAALDLNNPGCFHHPSFFAGVTVAPQLSQTTTIPGQPRQRPIPTLPPPRATAIPLQSQQHPPPTPPLSRVATIPVQPQQPPPPTQSVPPSSPHKYRDYRSYQQDTSPQFQSSESSSRVQKSRSPSRKLPVDPRPKFRGDPLVLTYRYKEFMQAFPLGEGEKENPYFVRLLANRDYPDNDDNGAYARAIRYAHRHPENFWEWKDVTIVERWANEDQKWQEAGAGIERVSVV